VQFSKQREDYRLKKYSNQWIISSKWPDNTNERISFEPIADSVLGLSNSRKMQTFGGYRQNDQKHLVDTGKSRKNIWWIPAFLLMPKVRSIMRLTLSYPIISIWFIQRIITGRMVLIIYQSIWQCSCSDQESYADVLRAKQYRGLQANLHWAVWVCGENVFL